MANESLIAYENLEKQKNLDKISALQEKALDIDNIIIQINIKFNDDVAFYEASKTDILQQITDIESKNVLIDEIISILNA